MEKMGKMFVAFGIFLLIISSIGILLAYTNDSGNNIPKVVKSASADSINPSCLVYDGSSFKMVSGDNAFMKCEPTTNALIEEGFHLCAVDKNYDLLLAKHDGANYGNGDHGC